MGNLANYIDFERFGRDVAMDEGGRFTDDGYIRNTGDGWTRMFDGSLDDIPDEYRLTGGGEEPMIAGHLQIKNDYYYMVLSYTDSDGKRKQPWIPTGLPVKGNKKRAEKMLIETRQTYVPPVSNGNGHLSADMLFADYMETWLEIIRGSVEKTTFSSYTQMVKKKIVPYFRDTGLTLGSIQAKHIQSFYLYELKSVSASTVIHEHANIHKALKYAVKMDLIPFNPADKVERPKSRNISPITTGLMNWRNFLK